jgi:uncharacterized protein YprB with RNaseH-like and TPR domain
VSRRLPSFFERGTQVENELGQHWRIEVPLDELWPGGSQLVAARSQVLRQRLAADSLWQPALDALPQRIVALDLETCGLGGAALFLVGLLRHTGTTPGQTDTSLAVELLLARNYAEEAAVLATLWTTLASDQVLLTFNGKSFDWPTVVDRSRRWLLDRRPPQGRPLPLDLPHYDLLHHARRRWRGVLPDCRLLTIERQICRRNRTGDIEGRAIPAAYDQFVRTGEPDSIEPVLYHNALDLVTLLDVTLRLAE